jgi:hypothetical protein
MVSVYLALTAETSAFATATCARRAGCTPSSEMQAPNVCVGLARFGTERMQLGCVRSWARSGFGSR